MNRKRNDSTVELDNLQLCDILHISQCTPDNAKRLADLHTAIAQVYRAMAGLNALPTESNQRRLRVEPYR